MGIKTRGYTDEDKKAGRSAQAGARGAFPPEGEYQVLKIDDARTLEVGRGEKLELQCVLDVKGEDVTRRWSGWTDNEPQMANAMEAFSREGDPDEIDAEELVGRQGNGVRAVVKHEKSPKDGKIYANIAYFLPPSGRERRGGERQREERPRDRQEQPRREERRDERGGRDGHGAKTYGGDGGNNRRDSRPRNDDADDTPF